MKNYTSYCFDLDGTVYRGSTVIPEAREFIHFLRAQGIRPFYVTNNAKMTQQQIYEKLSGMGIELERDHIMTSAIATAKYIAKYYPNETAFIIGETGLYEALEQEGIPIVEDHAQLVVQGLDTTLNYEKMELAGYQLQNGAKFIATNGDLKIPKERGFVPGNGSLVRLLAEVSNVEPISIGKPEPHMLAALQETFQLEKSRMIMIGDNYETDILAGIHFGIDTCHVNTGVSPTEQVRMQKLKPTYYVPTLEELKNFFE